jgi:hypothetical protein
MSMPAYLKDLSSDRVVEVDARPMLRAGQEPFAVIMDGVGRTPRDGALKLHATFRPTPLLHVLQSQGFAHWIEHGEGDHWVVWFYREDAASSSTPAAPAFEVDVAALQKDEPQLRERLVREADRWVLDVRGMSPPDPLELTLRVLDVLPRDAVLVQVNQRVPQFLLPLLDERGYDHAVLVNRDDEVQLEIRARA